MHGICERAKSFILNQALLNNSCQTLLHALNDSCLFAEVVMGRFQETEEETCLVAFGVLV